MTHGDAERVDGLFEFGINQRGRIFNHLTAFQLMPAYNQVEHMGD